MKKGFSLPLILAIITITSVLVGILVYLQLKSPASQVQPTPTSGKTSQSTSPHPTDEVTNWEVFQNEKYGFEMKYPPKYLSTSTNQKPNDYYDSLAVLALKSNFIKIKAIHDIDIYKDQSPKFVAEREISESPFSHKVKETKIGKYAAAVTELDDGAEGFIATINHPSRNVFIEVFAKLSSEEFDQILSTFKFLD